jgi:hypothetical protein
MYKLVETQLGFRPDPDFDSPLYDQYQEAQNALRNRWKELRAGIDDNGHPLWMVHSIGGSDFGSFIYELYDPTTEKADPNIPAHIVQIVPVREEMEAERTFLYAAFSSVPDYSAPAPTFLSVHRTLEGAKRALYPDDKYHETFTYRVKAMYWEGPDGFGLIRRVEVKD